MRAWPYTNTIPVPGRPRAWPCSVSFLWLERPLLDGLGQNVDQARRWPVPCFVGEIGESLEIGKQPDGVGLPGDGGNDGS